jgi:hypothetical protein
MKTFVSIAIGTFIATALPGMGWAQQQDLEVTIRMVPADAAADAATKVIELPADSASTQGQESSAFGIGIANKAREMRGELGREFGTAVSDEASQGRVQSQGRGATGKP